MYDNIQECRKVDVIFVSFARNSRDLTSLELYVHVSPVLHMFRSHMKQNYEYM